MDLRAAGLRLACALASLLYVTTASAAPPWSMGAPIVTYNNYSPRGYQLPDQPCGYNRALEAIYGWPKDYDPTVLTDAIARQAVAGGFNLVWVNEPSQVKVAEAHGLRAQLILSGPCLAQNNIYATND